jgi:hypothetical protein
MRASFKISLILAAVSVIAVTILTVLMHFRYHITQSNLINDRIGVTAASIQNIIDNSLKTGISIEAQNDLPDYIKRAKNNEEIIENIYVLKNLNWQLETVFKTENDFPLPAIKTASQKIKSSKTDNWSFSKTYDGIKTNYVGLTIRGPTGVELGAIVLTYKATVVEEQERGEIRELYRRMLFAISICIIFGFLIGVRTTKHLEKAVDTITSVIDKLQKEETNFDLSEIKDPFLKGNFRKAIMFSSDLSKDLNKIEKLIISAEKEEKND